MPKGHGIPTDEAIPMLADALAYYDESDVRRWFERNQRMTGRYPAVWASTIKNVRTFTKVPNEPFRQAFLDLNRPMILGETLNVTGSHEASSEGGHVFGEPEWCGLFRDELERIRALPEALDFRPTKIGPGDLSCQGISEYLRGSLGIKPSTKDGDITLAWLVQYEIAEVLCKVFGMTPYTVGI